MAEVECIIIYTVHKTTLDIHKLVVPLVLFDESLDSVTLADHSAKVLVRDQEPSEHINEDLKRRFTDW